MNLASGHTEKSPHQIGFLFGAQRSDACHVVGCKVLRDGNCENFLQDFTLTSQFIPGGLEICGIFFRTADSTNEATVTKCVEKFLPEIEEIKEFAERESTLILALPDQDGETSNLYDFNLDSQELTPVDYATEDTPTFMRLRVRGTLYIGFEVPSEKEKLVSNIESEITALKDLVEGETCAYLLHNSRILLHNNYGETSLDDALSPLSPCSLLSSHINESGDDPGQRKKRSTSSDILDFQLLLKMSGESALSNTVSCAPVIHHEHRQFKFSRLSLPVDALAYVRPDDPVEVIPDFLTSAVTSQLLHMLCCIINHSKETDFPVARPFHMLPSSLDHFVTVVYPENTDDDSLEAERISLHRQFLLPLNRPLLRRRNSFRFPADFVSDYLINPHKGLKNSVAGGKQFVVEGMYEYHHYMQDRMDDNGWGCAYRSLQTLISWFRLQGYSDKEIPTHQQIQQILVDIGDKPAKLVGSKAWIGSMEVSYVLQNYLDVDSKILFVSTGADLAAKARELAQHFITQGTPVMAGGGVLAQTILGVDWNEVSGDLKYLVLDPHYTGGEDLKVIQDKGWCGWKTQDFWDKTTFYNLCLPQRPNLI